MSHPATSPSVSPLADLRFDDLDVTCDEDAELAAEPTRAEAHVGDLAELWTWQRLVELADAAGKTRLASAFRSALDDERARSA